MNKGELVDFIASEAGLTKAQAAESLNAVTSAVQKTLKKGNKLTLVGFGTFSISKRAARTGRNPKTGAAIKIPAKRVVKFKAGKELSSKV